MADALTPLNIDAIRAMLGDRPALGRSAALDLIHEVERLRARVSDEPGECVMTHTPPFDFAQCETHDETFPLGGACRFHGRTSVAEVYADEADQMRARAVLAEAEVARLTARPAPAWDEDAVAEAVRRDLEAAGILPWTNGGARIVRTALAVVRDHLPVKPSREDVVRALAVSDVHHPDFCDCGQPVCGGTCDVEGEDCFCAAERCDGLEQQINAALGLWPGRSEAEVKAEGLREWIAEWPTTPDDGTFLADVARDGLARADRLAAEGGADRE